MKYLRTVQIGPFPYRLYRAKASEMEDKVGECHYDTRKILVLEGLDPKRAEEVLYHELLHAIWEASGVRETFATLSGLRGSKLDKAEEAIVSILSPALLTTLRGAGLLRGRKPKGTT